MTVWIIEDEAAAARRLEKLLLEIDPSIAIAAVLDSVEATLNQALLHPLPELLFMDIHLADGSSFEVFNHLKVDKPVIFTTAYDQYAIDAFKVNAIDYLLKPLKRPDLERAIEKYRQLASQPAIDYQQLAKAMQREKSGHRFLIRIGHQIRIVSLSDAAYFFTEDKITFVITWEGKRYPLDVSLEKVEELVEGQPFFRINRQFIIHLKAIREMYAYSKARVKLELTPPCSIETVVSTERSPHFKKWLQGE
jgi:two-component system, LytTR family, response regulator LytT